MDATRDRQRPRMRLVTDTVTVVPIPDDARVRRTVAEWSIDQWGADFPSDTIDTYLDLYEVAARDPDSLPIVLVAYVDGRLAGTATLVDDDELPDATEPGPWLAATYVDPSFRRIGVGHALVDAVESEARRLGHRRLFLYTHDAQRWYESRQWTPVRSALLGRAVVTVMCKELR